MSEPIKPLDLDLSSLAAPLEGDLSDDELYAPADVSELPERPLTLSVATLTNSPGCRPAAVAPSADATPGARPIRRARSVRVDAWSTPAPANWGRARRTVRKVQGRARAKGGTASADWSLPF